MNSAGRATAWTAALAASLTALVVTGDRLAPPPLGDPAALWAWLERTDPSVAAFSLVRLGAIVVVAYLLLATVLVLAADASRLPVLAAASSRLTLPSAALVIRRAVGAGLALTLAGSAATPLTASAAPLPGQGTVVELVVAIGSPSDPAGSDATSPPTAPAPVLHALDDPHLVHLGPAERAGDAADDDPPPAAAARPGRPPPGPMTTVPAAPSPAPGPPGPPPATDAPIAPSSGPATDPGAADLGTGAPSAPVAPAAPIDRPPAATEPAAAERTIVAGDHLWGVAELTLTAAWGATPEPSEVAAYLQRLVDANRSVLAVPDDPDLVFPGQVFTLPDVAPR